MRSGSARPAPGICPRRRRGRTRVAVAVSPVPGPAARGEAIWSKDETRRQPQTRTHARRTRPHCLPRLAAAMPEGRRRIGAARDLGGGRGLSPVAAEVEAEAAVFAADVEAKAAAAVA